MRELCCVGVNHKSAPVELREKVAFSADGVEPALANMLAQAGIREGLILSTCNRVELYAIGDPETTPFVLRSFLHRFHGLREGVLEDHLVHRTGEEALTHLFRVASSLDAIVVGEPQILGQVKDAYFRAAAAKATGPMMNRAFHRAFTVAKRVRTETRIAASAVSVSYAAVELARKIFGDLTGLQCLLVGAGEMGELAARHFVERGARLLVANRSFERAARLAETFGGAGREMSELPDLLCDVDIVLVSTGAPSYVIDREMVQKAARARRYRPLFLIDISVPRNVDPAAAKCEGVYVYDVDDLVHVVEENLDGRRAEAARAEAIVTDEAQRFTRVSRELSAVPIIKALRHKAVEVAMAEAQKTLLILGESASEKQKKSVVAMAQAIVAKLLHDPITRLRTEGGKGEGASPELFGLTAELFALAADADDDTTDAAAVMREAEAAVEAADEEDEELLLAGQ